MANKDKCIFKKYEGFRLKSSIVKIELTYGFLTLPRFRFKLSLSDSLIKIKSLHEK